MALHLIGSTNSLGVIRLKVLGLNVLVLNVLVLNSCASKFLDKLNIYTDSFEFLNILLIAKLIILSVIGLLTT